MTRIVKKPEERKRELLLIAFQQFIENGYENTSIRSILKEAQGEIGMFYHYFASKKEIFDACVDFYNEQYLTKISSEIKKEKTWQQKIVRMLDITFSFLNAYGEGTSQQTNIEVLTILHVTIIEKMCPLLLEQLKDDFNFCKYSTIEQGNFARFLTFGISGILHSDYAIEDETKKKHILDMLAIIYTGM